MAKGRFTGRGADPKAPGAYAHARRGMNGAAIADRVADALVG